MAEAYPFQPVSDVQTVAALLADETASRRVQLRVIGGFSVAGFLLAATGIHGLLSFALSERLPEIGVRWRSRGSDTMQAFLVGVDPGDLPTLVASVILVMSATLSGTVAPAIRAFTRGSRQRPALVVTGEKSQCSRR